MAIYHKGQRMDGGGGGGMSKEEADQWYMQKYGANLKSESFGITAETDERIFDFLIENCGLDIMAASKSGDDGSLIGAVASYLALSPGYISVAGRYNILSTSLDLEGGILKIESVNRHANVSEHFEFDARSGLTVSKCAEPETDEMPATKGYVDNAVSGASGVPSGVVVMWSGTAANIPDGWALCDGTNGTPDLRDRFVVGAGSSYSVGATGGEATHKLTEAEMPEHTHAISFNNTYGTYSSSGQQYLTGSGSRPTTIFTNGKGGSAAHNNMPPYYALCYIMKL